MPNGQSAKNRHNWQPVTDIKDVTFLLRMLYFRLVPETLKHVQFTERSTLQHAMHVRAEICIFRPKGLTYRSYQPFYIETSCLTSFSYIND